MDNEVWDKISVFIRELRCGDTKRADYIQLEETRRAMDLVRNSAVIYDSTLEELTTQQKNRITEHMELVDQLASEEANQVYCQGYVDCIQLLTGLGLLSKDDSVNQLIREIKK